VPATKYELVLERVPSPLSVYAVTTPPEAVVSDVRAKEPGLIGA
jgi:hypothetical protein